MTQKRKKKEPCQAVKCHRAIFYASCIIVSIVAACILRVCNAFKKTHSHRIKLSCLLITVIHLFSLCENK